MNKLLVAILLCASVVCAETPNVLVLFTDDQTYESLQYMDYLESMPHGKWTWFERAYVETSLCCPSRATFLTGKYSHTVGVTDNNGEALDLSNNIGVVMSDLGYVTAWYGKFLNFYPYGSDPLEIPPGWDDFKSGEPKYKNWTWNENGVLVAYPAPAYQTDVLAEKAQQFILSQDSKWFLVVSFLAPHNPSTPASRHKTASLSVSLSPAFYESDYSDKPSYIQALPLRSESNALQSKLADARTLLAVDEALEAIINALDSSNQLENTLIIFTTDNGFSHSSHRVIGKKVPYEDSVHVPLMIRHPDGIQHTESRLVSNIDLFPTILEVAGGTSNGDGASLVPLLKNESVVWRDAMLIARRNDGNNRQYYGVITEQYKYIEIANGERELYDLENDPYELVSQHNNGSFAAIKAELALKLKELKP